MIRYKKIWITGGGSGIGRAVALQLASQGNTVVISGRSESKLDDVKNHFHETHQGPGEILTLPFDVARDNRVEGVKSALAYLLGGLDIAIFSAGVAEYVNNGELNTEVFRRTFDTNLMGVVNATQIALSLFDQYRETDSGSNKPQLVAISSLSTVTGLPRAEAYGASKAALDYFYDALSIDIAHKGIDVGVVQPGFIHTPMTQQNDFAMPFVMSAEEAAERVIKAVATRRRLYRFPKRLYFTIKLSRTFSWLWYGYIAPALVRAEGNKN